MHSVLPDVEKACSLLLQKKLIYNKYDEVGIVVFGTEGTGNELATEIGGYEHVTVLRSIRVVDDFVAHHVKQLPRGTVAGDSCPTKDPFEGTKDDQVSTIAMKMAEEGIKMESIVMRSNFSGEAYEKVKEENDHLLNLFSSNAIAKTVNVESPLSLLGSLKTRRVAPVSVYRGDLEINPTMKIKVFFVLVKFFFSDFL